MKNPAPTDFPIHELIANRWSPRLFRKGNRTRRSFAASSKPPLGSIQQQRAALAFLVATATIEKFLQCACNRWSIHANWAKHAYFSVTPFPNSTLPKTIRPNRNAHTTPGPPWPCSLPKPFAWLMVHQMAGFDPDTTREVFDIPRVGTPSPPSHRYPATPLLSRVHIAPAKPRPAFATHRDFVSPANGPKPRLHLSNKVASAAGCLVVWSARNLRHAFESARHSQPKFICTVGLYC